MNLNVIPKLSDLLEKPERVSSLPPEAIPAMRGELARLDTLLLMRVAMARSNGNSRNESLEADNWLSAEQAAPILGVTPRWLYRHSKQLPFARRISRKVLRFSESGLRKWQATKRA